MLILTPDPRYSFTGRDGSPSDAAVVREMWVENVYQLCPEDFSDTQVLVDVGANIGAVSVWAAGYGASVVAVEPEPHNLDLLVRNGKDNNVDFTVCAWAVSDKPGSATINDGHGDSRLGRDGTTVEVVTLLEVFTRNHLEGCDVLKIDIEGSEYSMLEAVDADFLRRVGYITMEFHPADDDVFGRMVAKLAKVFNTHIIGSPERGGQIYGRRY